MTDRLARARGFLLDMDGTFFLGERLLEGALDFIALLRRQGKAFLFLTNNSSKDRQQYVEKITRLGLPISADQVLTSGEAAARVLMRDYPHANLFVVGTPSLEAEFRAAGFMLDHPQPQVAVVGFDTTLTYAKLWTLCDLVRAGRPYIVTHPDLNCPTPTGFMPDIGATIAYVKAATGRAPDLIVGKPSRLMAEAAAEKLGLPLASLAMVGDRLYTDIALGQAADIPAVLVLSGETHAEDVAGSPFQPAATFAHLGALAAWLAAQPEPVEGAMTFAYDPASAAFWDSISRLPGYPAGELRPIPIMLFESNALARLPEVLLASGVQAAGTVLVVMDGTPMRRGGQDLKPLVLATLQAAGLRAEPVLLAPDATGQVHTDLPHIAAVQQRLSDGAAVLSVGSGTVTDIAKHAAYLFEQAGGPRLPFVVLQTANSVSAYTSNMAPTFVDGVKRTLPSRYPDALVCDLETLRDAPRAMTVAGVGDLLAAFVSFPDWRLAQRLGLDDGYTHFPQTLMGPLDEIFLAEAEAIRSGTLAGMAVLAKLIALGGLAMSLAHATTPMSGYEHVMSHILDLLAEQAGQPLAQHGSQVALAAILGAAAYQHFLREFVPEEVNLARCYPTAEAMQARITHAFAAVDPSGRAGAECWADYQIKLAAWHAHRPQFEAALRDWPALRIELEHDARPPERLAEILRAIDAPLTFAELTPPASEAQAQFAFLNAPLMRKRLTLGDVLLFVNWDREALWQQVWAQAETLGARAALGVGTP